MSTHDPLTNERASLFQFGPFAYVAFALGHVETTAEGTDIRLEALRALNELGAILLDVKSVCETLPSKLAAENAADALTEIQWLAARVEEAGYVK